ncbi:MAG TPA: AsmA-like C-terminal region-containing protein [Pirellulaceae bacterium]|nr:AsmA-like C-terminal region-containing protein [Pirellulaceae bacterium]
MSTVAIQPAKRFGLIGWIFGHLRLLALVAIGSAVVLGALIYTGILGIDRLDEEIRQRVQAKLAANYPELKITVDAAQILQGQGIQVRGVRIQQPSGDAAELVYIDELLAACDTSLQELLTHEPHFTQITVRRAKLTATRSSNGQWNVASLLPLPKSGSDRVPIVIEDAAIAICDPACNAAKPLLLKNLNVKILPDNSPEALVVLPEAKGRGALKIVGQVGCDHFRQLTLDGWLDPVGGAWAFRGQIDALTITPALEDSLPIAIPTKLLSLHDLHGRLSLEYEVTNQQLANTPTSLPFHFALAGQLEEGRLDDARLPHPLTDLKASLFCDDGGVQIKEIFARCGSAKIQANLTREGWDAAAPLKLAGRIAQLVLDGPLAEALNEKQREIWDKFAPTGAIHADFDFSFDGRQWQKLIKAELLDVSIAYEKFPYRVTSAGGTVQLNNQELTFNTFGTAGGQRVTSKGQFLNPGSDFTGWIDIASESFLPLDERLILAMDAKAQKIVHAIAPRGEATFRFRLNREDARDKIEPHLQIALKDCAIRYQKFPYPLDRIQGFIELKAGQWSFNKLEGANDSAYVLGQGSLVTDRIGDQILTFEFASSDVPLEDDLKHALPEKMQSLWTDLHPSGTLDTLKILISYNCTTRQLSVDVAGHKYPRKQLSPDDRSVTLEPTWFPYRLGHVTGGFHYRDGDIELKNLKATHGRTTIAADAACQMNPDGGWNLTLDRVIADRLTVDHDLLAALPKAASEALAKLNISGPIQLFGNATMTNDGRTKQPTGATWDVSLDLENGGLDAGARLDHIHGGVRIVGSANERGAKAMGELAVDSVTCNGVQFTQVIGPISIENERLLFGAWAEQPRQGNKPPRQITAKVFEGSLAGDALIAFDKDAGFEVQTALTDGNLARISAEAAPNRRGITGKAEGFIKLAGSRNGRHTWNGGGVVRLREADIYEVPVMVALLKLLSIRQPDKKAFDTTDMDFRIQGDHIYIDKLDFRGDAVTLKGSGEADWQKHINLQFYTMVGRDELNVPILRPLIGEASRQLMLIQVGGNLDQPLLTRQAFPGLNETLQQIFPEAKLK